MAATAIQREVPLSRLVLDRVLDIESPSVLALKRFAAEENSVTLLKVFPASPIGVALDILFPDLVSKGETPLKLSKEV